MPTSTNQNFLDRISASKEAKALYAEIINNFGNKVKHTNTCGGDLRIKATKNSSNRIVFTMSWQPRDGHFLCRGYKLGNFKSDSALNITFRQPASPTEPLRSEFDYKPDSNSDADFMKLIEKAICNWVNE